eukprot:tig00000113_g5625.t1
MWGYARLALGSYGGVGGYESAPSFARAADIPAGQGAVLSRGPLDKVAAYRDDNGRLHLCSAGSRFDARGRVLEGPANADLPGVRLDPGDPRLRGVPRGSPSEEVADPAAESRGAEAVPRRPLTEGAKAGRAGGH